MGNNKQSVLSHYKVALTITAIIMALTFWVSGFSALLPLIALAVIEITFSFENAVINSQVLAGMSKFWQTMFLTVGIAVAVFGVRLIMPLFLVAATAGHSMGYVMDLALHQPDTYTEELHSAYPVIAAFGGIFLLMIGLRFFGERREIRWIKGVEAPLSDFNQPWWISIVGATLGTGLIYLIIAPGNRRVVMAAIAGAVTFFVIKIISQMLMRKNIEAGKRKGQAHGVAGFTQFLYLELLDASFSFDGVIAAFAITKKVFIIAAGLGIGALYVRSITVHLLKQGTLTHYRYLIHGAHYAITALALLLIASIRINIPEVISGLLGLLIIGAAFESSRRHNRRHSNVQTA